MKANIIILLFLTFTDCAIQQKFKNLSLAKPVNPNPAINSTIKTTDDIFLSWQCFNPENDTLKFDIYFGENRELNNRNLLEKDLMENSLKIHPDKGVAEYFWKVVVFDGKSRIEGDVWNFKIKYYLPDWWMIQDNPDKIFSFGMSESDSQMQAFENAVLEAISDKKIFIEEYLQKKMEVFIEEAMISEPKFMQMSWQLITVVSNKDFSIDSSKKQETIFAENKLYKTFVRAAISKKEIDKTLYQKIQLAPLLFEELKFSASFHEFIKHTAN
ncbi:MAG: hypothetical protein H8E57_07745 [Candidatus Cloacimonetes bacterium]|nr:hypothetical protein [Candidatus Cloacimonadota bacterium]